MATASDLDWQYKGKSRARWYPAVKRLMDVVLASAAIVLLALPMLLIACLILIIDGRPVIYRQARLGRGGKEIQLLKFRSMVPNAEEKLAALPEELRQQYQKEYKIEHDPRVTKLGSFLRRTSLDELPQLWNVLKGELSLIGPRPILPEEIRYYRPEDRAALLSVLPGLSGYWQAYAGREDTYTSGRRQTMELFYARHLSVGLDLKIFLCTFVAVIRKMVRK